VAVIIFPGGGYWINAIKHEGLDVAEYLRDNGIAAFVVKYRIPDSNTMEEKHKGPLQDAQQAIRTVRQRAAEFHIDPAKIGVLGFSAGGHLASTASTHYRFSLEGEALRPNFSILIYPVVSFSDSIGHSGSRIALLGQHPPQSMVEHYSNEKQVDSTTPPAFLVHAKDDPVSYKNSLVYEDALKRHGIPVKTLYFEKGGHGYGMWNKQSTEQWPPMVVEWLKQW
jgi:acetyl esterase/lipase